jgi:hypothetical protein
MLENSNIIKAFISCSLREEDKEFIDLVCNILIAHKILPFGTVGKFSASPENPLELMKTNIPLSDIVVICATPRYFQVDLMTGQESYGLSEMVHVEAGIAIANNKPVVVIVQEGTNIGKALPNVTQYIELNGKRDDYNSKKPLIRSLLMNAKKMVYNINYEKTIKLIIKIVIAVLAIYGAIKVFQALFGKK